MVRLGTAQIKIPHTESGASSATNRTLNSSLNSSTGSSRMSSAIATVNISQLVPRPPSKGGFERRTPKTMKIINFTDTPSSSVMSTPKAS